MKKNTKCKTCNYNIKVTGTPGKHRVVDTGMFCPVCNKTVKSIFHSEHDGFSLECRSCHNYILYFSDEEGDGNNLIWKDETYYEDSRYCLIRNLEDHSSALLCDEDKVLELDTIVDIKNVNSLLSRLKKLIIFS